MNSDATMHAMLTAACERKQNFVTISQPKKSD